jgi:hypothetical protein
MSSSLLVFVVGINAIVCDRSKATKYTEVGFIRVVKAYKNLI